ncbi:Rop family plasmid primer RNA-binding protein [Escherichia coli]|nr:Rop family plasmid primer RNA-binding protein [Escherichia coli]EIM2916453.1 Rop family plasmid primer RNA-binding protein [Escherichia coli]
MTKQEKTALNMARFIRSQTLTLLEKLNELDADEQADMGSDAQWNENSR